MEHIFGKDNIILQDKDDIVIMAETMQYLKEIMYGLAESSKRIGLRMNLDKTKKFNKYVNPGPIIDDGVPLKASAGMTLRSAPRRISPRAKRRCRAIKDFLQRALGNSSQQDIKIHSSIAINVSDLKHKIVGIEKQLTAVNKHCRELVSLDSSSRAESRALFFDDRFELPSLKEGTEVSSAKSVHHGNETKLLYKTSKSHYQKSSNSDDSKLVYRDLENNDIKLPDASALQDEKKIRRKKSKLDTRFIDKNYHDLEKHTAKSAYDNFSSSIGATTSYHSLCDPKTSERRRRRVNYPRHCYEDRYRNLNEYIEPIAEEIRNENQSRRYKPEKFEAQYEGKRKHKSKIKTREVNKDFIADIIERQYKPIRMFARRQSDLSQFSVPVCRDQECTTHENIIEGSKLCSCCFDGHKKSKYEVEYGINDVRSICDTRLYSARRRTRQKHHKKHTDNYNDSNQYDLIPVKEKSSPKSRRKFISETMPTYGYLKEVPPSPRTHRPRLNLKAQHYAECEDDMFNNKKYRNGSPNRFNGHGNHTEHFASNKSAILLHKDKRKSQVVLKKQNEDYIEQNVGTMSSLQSPLYINEQVTITQDSTLNKTQENDSAGDKTDKALSEIKDILQSFLQEIKKGTSMSHCGSHMNAKAEDQCLNELRQDSLKFNTPVLPNSGHSVNNCSVVPQCGLSAPFFQSFPNPCCYPVLPVCPMNCMQNGLVMPSQSFTCAACANNAKDVCHKHINTNTTNNSNTDTNKISSETDELIKEIYKFVTRSPISNRRKEFCERTTMDSPKNGKLTSRSVGAGSRLSRHDAQVETQKIKCQSKSCEAICSRLLSDTSYSRTNPSYSDTILERLSPLATTSSETGLSSKSVNLKKEKKNKFAKVLQSFGLFKKKKDVIEELSESESTVEVEVKAKKPPFRQDIMNYLIHEHQYYNKPPYPDESYQPPPNFPHGCHIGCPDHLQHGNPMQAQYHHIHSPKLNHHEPTEPLYHSMHHPLASPYHNQCKGMHQNPQVPLCLKEIEVKSIGTQSNRKMPLFRKFTKRMQSPTYPAPRIDQAQTCSTQTAEKPTFFNWKAQLAKSKEHGDRMGKDKPAQWTWKTLQAKINQLDRPDEFSYKTQQKLAQGDIKMRNAMLKKMFYKRNPFSPRNLIMKTLLGRDKASFGEPPMMYRPRMFY